MAATRHTVPAAKLRRGHTKVFCTTCGSERLRDGGLGAMQSPHYCTPECYVRYRQYALPRIFASSGAGYSQQVFPASPGGVGVS